MSVELENSATEERHQAALQLRADEPNSVGRMLAFLADPNWRVRKAALSRLHEFSNRPTLLVDLIAGLADETNAGLRNACAEALVQIGTGVEPLIAALRTTNSAQRKIVAEILGQIGTTTAQQRLLECLDDPDPNARSAVAEALGNIGGDAVIAELSRRLVTSLGDLHQSAYLLDALGRAGARLSFAQLEPWLGQRALARHLYPLLGFCGDARAIAPLVDGVLAKSWGNRTAAVLALAELCRRLDPEGLAALRHRLGAQEAARQVLIDAMGRDDDAVGAAATRILGVSGDPTLAPLIAEACANRSFAQVGLEVILALGRDCVQPLCEAVTGFDVDTRVLTMEIFETLGDGNVVPLCVEVATADEPRAAEAAIRVLGRHGSADTASDLIELVIRGDSELVETAAVALAEIAKRHTDVVATRLAGMLRAGSIHPVWYFVLGELRRPEDLPLLLAGAEQSDAFARHGALRALSTYGQQVPLEVFLAALCESSPPVRVTAATALGLYASDRAVAALQTALHDDDPWVVAQAVESLGKCDAKQAVPGIEEAANLGRSQVVIAALRSLIKLAPQRLEPLVRKALEHEEAEVVREALNTAAFLGEPTAQRILIAMMQHESWEVRRGCAEVLAEHRIPVPEQLVRDQIATESEPLVRVALARLIPLAEET
jgi:HEAT repeat protein